MKRKRILITTFTFPPEYKGVSEVAWSHAVGLSNRGYDVTIATSRNTHRNLTQYSEKFKVIEFEISGNLNPRVRITGEIKKYISFLKDSSFDIIFFHCWHIWTTDLALGIMNDIPSKKVLVSHGYSANSMLGFPKSIFNWLLWRPYVWKTSEYIRSFDHIIFLSQKQDLDRFYDFYLTNKIDYRNWSIIPNGASIKSYKESSVSIKEKICITEGPLILNVSAYSPYKNQEFILRSFYMIKENATLLFIGNEYNSYTKRLETIYENLSKKYDNRKKIFFLYNLSKEEIKSAYSNADIFAFSSKTEVQPLVVIDALASGLPFLSTNVGCVYDFPGGKVVNSEREMAKWMSKLINDEGVRKELGSAGKHAYDVSYNWDNAINEYAYLIERIL